jgi:molybdate transport system regulatory protein
MNRLEAKILRVQSSQHISLVSLEAQGDEFSCVVIETPETADYLEAGKRVHILFKETEVAIAKGLKGGISLRNRLAATIKTIHKGRVLTELVLDYKGLDIGAIVTSRSADELRLAVGDQVLGLVKANEVSIMEIESS